MNKFTLIALLCLFSTAVIAQDDDPFEDDWDDNWTDDQVDTDLPSTDNGDS